MQVFSPGSASKILCLKTAVRTSDRTAFVHAIYGIYFQRVQVCWESLKKMLNEEWPHFTKERMKNDQIEQRWPYSTK